MTPATLAAPSPGKPFHPVLKGTASKSGFTVYEKPVALTNTNGGKLVGADAGQQSESSNALGQAAVNFISDVSGTPSQNIRISSQYTDKNSGITHVYMVQSIGGVDVANGIANVNLGSDGVISSGHSFAPATSVQKLAAIKDPFGAWAKDSASNVDEIKKALGTLSSFLGHQNQIQKLGEVKLAVVNSLTGGSQHYSIEGLPTELSLDGLGIAERSYIQSANGDITACWRINLEQENHWWNAHVGLDGKVLKLVDWYANSESYQVYAKEVLSPADGKRTLVVDPADDRSSPKGWVTEGSTYGNNVWAQSNPYGGSTWKNNYRPKASSSGSFNYPLDLSKAPKTYIDAAITQLFYTNNIMHDLSFLYGFDEAAGNFQDINYSGQGLGNDAVIANAQDGSGTNNANFATPPDGQRPRMRMYTWTMTQPNRDGDFEQDIVAHEYTHGISNRLTGGPANTDCLDTGESGGMGEGWSDAVANILRLNSTHTAKTDFILGEYSYSKNIRRYPYSTNLRTNPSTFKFLDRSDYQEVHDIGEVWAEILYEAMWELVTKLGWGDLFDVDLSKGNSLMLRILLDGMKLQPCNPSFIDARNAILQAEKNLTGGKNQCELWRAFAKRGMGVKASGGEGTTHIEDYALPSGC
ncbi:hypothetical protein GGI07_005526 [Coemansia sp. Benny D115]|nr:hypothetical protein GGI07_005526 [Coemansia sp. Benny D115]